MAILFSRCDGFRRSQKGPHNASIPFQSSQMRMGFSRFLCYSPKAALSGSTSAGKMASFTHHHGSFLLPSCQRSYSFGAFHSSSNGVASGSPAYVSERMLHGANAIESLSNYKGLCPFPASRLEFHRSSHGLVKTQFFVEAIDDATSSNSKRTSEDAEKVCRILSKEPNSSIFPSLDQSGVTVSHELVVEVLKKLSNAGILALSFFRWVEKQQGFKHSAECYHHLIEALGRIKQFRLIWDLVGAMEDQRILMKETFALISRRYARARNIQGAVEAFEKMRNYGLKPDISDFNRLLDTLGKSKNVKTAQEIFVDMRRRNRFTPDLKTYTILLEGWGSVLDIARLTQVYQEMMDGGFEPDTVAYGILIHGFVKCRKLDEAIKLFHEMVARNLKPGPHIFCSLINGLGSEKRLLEALKYFELSKASSFPLDIPMCNSVVGAYCWVQQFENAYRTLAEMKTSGLGPNARTYEIILHHLIKAHRIEEAYMVFQGMAGESGCEPELNTYTMMVRMFCAEERVDMALKIWQQMSEKGIIPCMHMYSVLINGLLIEHRLEEACDYFQEMLDRGIRPPGLLYGNLKQVLLKEGKEDLAMHMGSQLDRLRRTPMTG
uniref:Pentatricopeptide repeat-containing protein At1g71060, mitochondrial n=1 Tax=Anthurium amnicola TaxID=1678845 RepID=A0A1D1XGK7_9ARAE